MASAPDLCMSAEGDEFSVSKNCKRRYPHQPAGHGTCWTFQPMPEEADQKVEFVSGAAPRIRLRSVVGLDVGKSATKAVFIRQTKSGMVVSEARLLPPGCFLPRRAPGGDIASLVEEQLCGAGSVSAGGDGEICDTAWPAGRAFEVGS